MAALTTLAAIGIGLAAKAFAGKPYQQAPTQVFAPKPVDPAITAQKNAEAAQYAAAVERRRAQGQTGAIPTVQTGPAGLPTPAPVQRKTLLGQ